MIPLSQAIESLYEVFGDQYRPRAISVWPGWEVTPTQVAALQSKDRRQLTSGDIESYSWEVLGDRPPGVVQEEDIRYFLPRILELMCYPLRDRGGRGPDMPDPHYVMSGLFRVGFQDWPEPQQEALKQFFRSALAGPGREQDKFLDDWSSLTAFEILQSLPFIESDLRPYLELISDNKGEIEFIARIMKISNTGTCGRSFFEEHSFDLQSWTKERSEFVRARAESQVQEWLKDPRVKKHIENLKGNAP